MTFDTALNEFINALTAHGAGVVSVREAKGPPRRYLPIDGGTSVYCFVEVESGDILKAASWRKPAIGKRGNIYDPETYLRNKGNFQYGRWLYRDHNK